MQDENEQSQPNKRPNQQGVRNRAIKLREDGISNNETAKVLGVNKETTSKWYSSYKRDGAKAIKVKKTGRPKNVGKKLSDEQETMIIKKLIDTTPKQLKFKFALWTREAVQTLIKYVLDVDMPISTVGYYLAKWQITSKKPIKRAYERKDGRTKQWLESEYPKIQKEAKKDNADIWWCDETACQNLANNLKGYAPIGTHNKPVLEHSAKRFKINMISAITNTGKSMFSLYDESIKINSFIEFCKKVIDSNNDKKVFLIVDNLRVHHAKLVKAWEEEHKDKIKLFYLPAYSPDYNPDEYLNQDYKQSANKYELPTTQKQLHSNTEKYMLSLQQNPQKVANFFKHPKVQYAS
jgi:transposase